MNFLKIFSRIKMVSFYGKIYKLILYDLIIPSAKGYLYDSTVASYNIFSSAVAFLRKQSLSKRRLRRIGMRCFSTVCPEVMIRIGVKCIECW